MNETDIKKCIKNGYFWSSYGDHPTKRHIDADTMRNVLSGNKSRHATKREAQLAIATRREQARVDARKAAQAALDKAKGVESRKTPVGETQQKEVATDETQKPREWTDIPQPLALRKPTLAEAINVIIEAVESYHSEGYLESHRQDHLAMMHGFAKQLGLKIRAVE